MHSRFAAQFEAFAAPVLDAEPLNSRQCLFRPAVKYIGTLTTGEQVVAVTAEQGVGATVAEEEVVAVEPFDFVVVRRPHEEVPVGVSVNEPASKSGSKFSE